MSEQKPKSKVGAPIRFQDQYHQRNREYFLAYDREIRKICKETGCTVPEARKIRKLHVLQEKLKTPEEAKENVQS